MVCLTNAFKRQRYNRGGRPIRGRNGRFAQIVQLPRTAQLVCDFIVPGLKVIGTFFEPECDSTQTFPGFRGVASSAGARVDDS